jgi:hypothetical protein
MPVARSYGWDSQYTLPGSSGAGRLNPRAFAAPSAAWAQGIGQVTDALAEMQDRTRRAESAIALAKANTAATEELGQFALSLERDPDWATVPKRYAEGAEQIRKKHAAALADPAVRQDFEEGFSRSAAPLGIEMRRKALQTGEKDALATLDATIEVQARAAALAPNGEARRRADATVARTVADLADAGWIDPLKAQTELKRYRSRAAEAQVRGLMTRDPEAVQAALDDTAQFADLDPVMRSQLADLAARRVESVQRQRLAEQERQDRLSAKRLTDAQNAASKALWDQWAKDGGRLDVEAVRREQARLNEGDYRALLQAALARDAGRDQDEAVRELKLHVDAEQPRDFERRAFDLLQAGRITLATYRAEVDRNRTVTADDRPASPYRSGREFVKVSLDPGQLGGSPEIRQPLAIAQQRALTEYDVWIEKNPGIDRTAALQKAEEVTQAFQNAGFAEMRLSLPRPRGFTGRKADVASADLDRARAGVLADLEAGRVSRDQAAAELSSLETWERVLAKTAAPKPTGAK